MDISSANWAKPNSEQARNIIDLTNAEFLKSFSYLADFSGAEEEARYLEGLSAIDVRSLSPQLLALHETLRLAIEQEDDEARDACIGGLIDEIDARKGQRECRRVLRYGNGYGKIAQHAIDVVSKKADIETYGGKYAGVTTEIHVPTVTQKLETELVVTRALNVLQEADGPHRREIDAIVKDFVIVNSNGVNAGTCLYTLGSVTIRAFRPSEEHWSRIVEHVVHESAHNLLYYVWYHGKVLTDDEGSFFTPFRLDHRPLSAIFHAMFVLCRTILAFDKILKIDGYGLRKSDIRSSYNEANNGMSFTEKFYETVRVATSSRKLTEFGSKILTDCVLVVQECESTI